MLMLMLVLPHGDFSLIRGLLIDGLRVLCERSRNNDKPLLLLLLLLPLPLLLPAAAKPAAGSWRLAASSIQQVLGQAAF